MSDVIQPPPAPPGFPPTEPFVYEAPPRPSSWPTVLGVIAIVFGVLGLLGAIWGLVGAEVMQSASGVNQAEIDELNARYEWWLKPGSVLAGVLAALLLIAGIGLVRRRAWSRTVALTWAVLKIMLVLINSAITYQATQVAVQAAMSAQTTTGPTTLPVAGIASAAAGIGVCFALVWGWALPVFMIIWLSRATIRQEMAAWGGRPADAM